jgi:hypothetical protein
MMFESQHLTKNREPVTNVFEDGNWLKWFPQHTNTLSTNYSNTHLMETNLLLLTTKKDRQKAQSVVRNMYN